METGYRLALEVFLDPSKQEERTKRTGKLTHTDELHTRKSQHLRVLSEGFW